MKKFIINPFHLVEVSPWPIIGASGAFMLTSGITQWFHGESKNLLLSGFLLILITMTQWWRDVVRESTFQGYHTQKTTRGLQMGMVLFIISEICFFFAFFWAFFHSSLSPTIEMGNLWPPKGVNPLSPWGIPLLNTMVLLSSGVTVTWSHHSLLSNNFHEAFLGLLSTVVLGVYFTFLQGSEYIETSFSMADSAYGTTFFVATGFHGLHVMIGTTFLAVCVLRLMRMHFSETHHTGFEAAAWYWHFVDVVWLFLFISIYWWGS